MTLTREKMKEQLKYNPDTGHFVWRVAKRGLAAGTAAVAKRPDGYVRICLNKKLYYAHRLAFLYMTGNWPAKHIDHINGNPGDNRWCNLRGATVAQNLANSGCFAASGLKGAYKSRQGRWRSAITVAGKRSHLGTFATAFEAHRAYVSAAKRHHGNFARTEQT